jgi:LL-diaminopimelate aminotransferase
MMDFAVSQRLKALPPYLFIEIDKKKKAALERGVDLIDLGVGDPDLPTPKPILASLAKASLNPANHQYPLGQGLPAFRKTAADWFARRFGPRFDPNGEVLALIGSKEGIGHFPLAVMDPGQVGLIPDPGYPVYNAGTLFAGGEPVFMPLLEKNGYLPDFGKIPAAKLKRARVLWLNYPNNPTAATAPLSFFKEAVAFCRRHGIILAHDMAYSEVYYDGQAPHSVMEAPGAREVAIEFHSLSKTFNMTGWRVGFAVGRRDLVQALASVKGNLDSGVVSAIQEMGITGLNAPAALTAGIRKVYQERRDPFIAGLKQAGIKVKAPKAAFYVWARVPQGETSASFCGRLLDQAGIVATPGNGFGASGEGYFRMTLCAPKARLAQAVARIKALRG